MAILAKALVTLYKLNYSHAEWYFIFSLPQEVVDEL